METICMKYQILFSGKIWKKYFNKSSAENITQHAKRLSTPLRSMKTIFRLGLLFRSINTPCTVYGCIIHKTLT